MAADPPAGGGDFLHKKLGPLTGMQWALIVGGAVGLVILIKKRQAAASSSTSGGTTDAYGDQFDASGNLVYAAPGGPYSAVAGVANAATGGGGGGATSGSGGTGTTTSPLTFLTNTDWLTAAYNDLVGHGYDPTSALAALTNYVDSQPLSSQQQSILDAALQYAGSPPQAVPLVTAPVTTPSQTTPAAPSSPPASQLSDAQLYSALTQQVGSLSQTTGINAPQSLVAQWFQRFAGESSQQQNFDVEAQNVGYVTGQLHGQVPTSAAQLLPAAYAAAGGQAAYQALDPFAQQVYLQQANVSAYQQGLAAGTIHK